MRRGYALLDLVFSAVPCIIMIIILIPVFSRARKNVRRSTCQSNLKQISMAFLQYVRDNEDKFPSSRISSTNTWANSIQPYAQSESIFQCAENRNQRENLTDYFYNARLSDAKIKDIPFPAATILAGDGNCDAPLGTAISSLPQGWRDYQQSPTYRHLEGANYAFSDGHVKWFKVEKVTLESPKRADVYTFLVH